MKVVEWQDRLGKKRRSLVRDEDPASMAMQGIPLDPPDIELLPWEQIKIDLHNALYDRGIVTWDDVVAQQTALRSAAISALKNHLVKLYRETQGTH